MEGERAILAVEMRPKCEMEAITLQLLSPLEMYRDYAETVKIAQA